MMQDVRQAAGLFLALLAIVAQLTLSVGARAPSVSLADATILCHHDGEAKAPVSPAHHSPDCQVCFFCHAAVAVVSPPLLPAPITMLIARAAVPPPATAPPPRMVLAARPRGPPIPV